MKSLKKNFHRMPLLSLLLAATLILPGLLPAAAQGPGDQPVFESAVYALPGGASAITSSQAALTSDYFGGAGASENLTVSADRLALASGATSGVYTSAPIRSPLNYTTDIGMTWLADIPEGASVTVEARLSGDGQAWGEWQPVPVEFYPVGEGEYSGALLWVDTASVYLQFKLTLQGSASAAPLFRRLTLYFNDTSQGPTDIVAGAQAQVDPAGAAVCPAKPAVISRTSWGCPDGQSSPRWPAAYQAVTHIVINHTATSNTATDWAKVVRSIWNYHANTLKWGDVGYHYLIDPQGRIYEGRAGGDDVIGAYDGFNRGSMGIGYIGCYGNCEYLGIPNADPSAAMLEAGNNLMAWKAGQKGINPTGSGTYCNATLPTIVPRSEVTCRGGSSSPGDRMRAQIPAMRTAVQQKIAACGGGATTVRVNPSFVQIPGGHSKVTDVEVTNVTGLYGVQFRMTYNPSLVGVVDADPNTAGVQIALGSIFAGQSVNVARNAVDTTNGVIEFAATLVSPAAPFNGTGSIARITWRGDRLGTTDLSLSNVALSDRNGQAISHRVENGKLEVVWPTICGAVLLQGRTNHSGTSLTLLPGGPSVTTNAQGQFCFEPTSTSYSTLKVVRRSYLIGEKASPQGGVGTLTLPGGDVNSACGGDNCINIYDLTLIAGCFGSTACLNDNAKSCVDINGDGKVDILDLTIAAGNFGKCGPVKDWK